MFRSMCLAATLISSASAFAAAYPFQTMNAADLAAKMKTSNVRIYDANNEGTRSDAGIIPGAQLLSSSMKYDAATELPADKKTPLVFYCANTQCTASHSAAKKALGSGYTDVSVMTDGIYGWKKSGEPVESLAQTSRVIEPKAASELVSLHSAVIVDVREGEERHDVVPGAQWMPLSRSKDAKAWKEFVASLPKDKTVVFHCAMGSRAESAARKLSSQGFKTAYFKGTDEWKAAGLPLEKGPARN